MDYETNLLRSVLIDNRVLSIVYRFCGKIERAKPIKLDNLYFYLDSYVSLLLIIIIYIIERISSIWVFKVTIICFKIILTCSWLTCPFALFIRIWWMTCIYTFLYYLKTKYDPHVIIIKMCLLCKLNDNSKHYLFWYMCNISQNTIYG